MRNCHIAGITYTHASLILIVSGNCVFMSRQCSKYLCDCVSFDCIVIDSSSDDEESAEYIVIDSSSDDKECAVCKRYA